MQQENREKNPLSRRSASTIATVLGVLVATSLVVTVSAVVGASQTHAAVSAASGGGDPPAPINGPPNPVILNGPVKPDSLAGYSVATYWPIVVVGIPGANNSGFYSAGEVLVENMVTGASTTLMSPNPGLETYFGLSLAISSTTLVVGAPDEGCNNLSAVYVYSSSTLHLEQTLTDPNIRCGGLFGWSVATFGTQVVVGAPGENESGNTTAGAVYFFSPPTWLPSEIRSPNPTTNGYFGYSLSLSGSTVIVGAPGETGGGVAGSGVAYQFDGVTGDVVRSFSSPWPVTGSDGYFGLSGFGASVSVVGNLLAVGNPASAGPNSSNPAGSGAVFEYNLVTGARTVLVSPNPQADGYFGNAVAIGLGGGYLAVGAANENASTVDGGNAYLFAVPLGAAEFGVFTSPAPVRMGAFGFSVAVNGGNLIVGAPAEGQNESGHAYVFQSPALSLVGGPNPASYSLFGFSVATAGPYVVTGAPALGEDNGIAFILNLRTSSELAVVNPSGQGGDLFGYSVAVSGNLVAVGAPLFSSTVYSGVGEVWVFNASTGAVVQNISEPHAYAGNETVFGVSVALSGTTLLVGAPYYHDEAGVEFVCGALNGSCSTAFAPTAQPDALVGWSSAINGTTGIVGAPGLDVTSGQLYAGAGGAWLLDLQSGLTSIALASPHPQAYGQFGHSVAVDQNAAIVGAPSENSSEVANAGQAYLFNSGSGALTATLASPAPHPNGDFGWAVGIAGGTAVVGAPGETSVSAAYGSHPSGGNVYLFNAQTGGLYLNVLNPNAEDNTEFGYAVAIANRTIVMSQPDASIYGAPEDGTVLIL